MAIGCVKCGGTSFFREDEVTQIIRRQANGTLYDSIEKLKEVTPYTGSIMSSEIKVGDAWRCYDCKEIIVEMPKQEEVKEDDLPF